jgi:hypothetical protein
MIRAIVVAAFVMLVVTAGSLKAAEAQLTGSWSITWEQDAKNVNPITLTESDRKIAGTYINDATETCKVAGQVDRAKGTVVFTITGPRWDIKCNGVIVNSNSIQGRYLAYGNATGTFEMARKK